MKRIIFVILCLGIVSALSESKAALKNDECLNCHQSLGDDPSQMFLKDIHYMKGISCSSCHGGNNKSDDMDIAMNKRKGFIGIPKGDKISEICSSCHSNKEIMVKYGSNLPTNQFSMLQKSVHGKLSITGNERIVQCITCHNAHGIVSVKNPSSPVYPLQIPKTCSRCHSNSVFMRAYNPKLPVDQLEKYRSSVHGMRNAKGDTKTAECVSCHGSHDILSASDVFSKVYVTKIPSTCSKCHSDAEYMKKYKIPTDQYKKYSHSVHGIALLEKNDLSAPACNDCHGNHAATPPGIESVSKVCGTCHPLNANLFSKSPHKKAFDESNYPECETCHGNHQIITSINKLLGVDKEAVCSKCHTQNKNEKGYIATIDMRKQIDSLNYLEKRGLVLIAEAEQKGMDVSEARFKLRDVKQAKIEAKTMIHAFNQAKFDSVIKTKGLKIGLEINAEAQHAIDEYYFRRIGLSASVLIISFLALTLFLYIKKIEKK